VTALKPLALVLSAPSRYDSPQAAREAPPTSAVALATGRLVLTSKMPGKAAGAAIR